MASPTASKPAKSNKLSIKGLDVSAVKKTKTAGIRPKLVEFMYHGAAELWLVDNKGATAVRGGNLGSGQFSWEDSEGRLWVIPNYPWDNNHKPVSGMIISEGDMVVGKFTLLSIKSKGPQRSFAERQAINAPIQGSAADIIKRAMIRMPDVLAKASLSARMLLQVHDELVFECPEAEADKLIETVKTSMQAAAGPSL